MQTAERIIEQVEASCRVELSVMQEQQMASLQALQGQLREQLVGERQAMDVELEGRAKLLSAQMGQLKQTHAQAMAGRDMWARHVSEHVERATATCCGLRRGRAVRVDADR